jgi:hypothetical protein
MQLRILVILAALIIAGCESMTSPDTIAVYSDTARAAIVAGERPTEAPISTEQEDWLTENGYTRFVGVEQDTTASTGSLWVGSALYVKREE